MLCFCVGVVALCFVSSLFPPFPPLCVCSSEEERLCKATPVVQVAATKLQLVGQNSAKAVEAWPESRDMHPAQGGVGCADMAGAGVGGNTPPTSPQPAMPIPVPSTVQSVQSAFATCLSAVSVVLSCVCYHRPCYCLLWGRHFVQIFSGASVFGKPWCSRRSVPVIQQR